MLSFFDIIQAYFTKLTGRFMMFSGRDMALLEGWRSQGATAVAICRGVRDAVLHMGEDRPPRDLYNCRVFIETYVGRARARSVAHASEAVMSDASAAGVASGGLEWGSGTPARRALRAIEEAGARCERASTRELYRQAWHQARRVALGAGEEDQYGALLELEEALADAYFEALSEGERRQVERRIEEEVAMLGGRMSEEAWRCHLAARRRFLMVREYGLVSLLD